MRPINMLRAALGALVLTGIAGGSARAQEKVPADATLVYVGTYTGEKSKGIHAFRLQSEDHASQNITLVPLGLAAEIQSPSFLEVDAKRRLIFAVNETDKFAGKSTG